MRSPAWKFFGLFLGILGACESALAYIPPSEFIVKNWVNKHSAKSVRIRSQISAFEGNKLNGDTFKETLVFRADSQSIRDWATDDSDKTLLGKEGGLGSFSLMTQLLLSNDSKFVVRALKSRGIPVRSEEELLSLRAEFERRKAEKEFLARWNSTYAWVISDAKDTDSSQLWLEKDRNLPLRLLVSLNQEVYDLRFEDYQFFSGFPYPRVISVYKKGQIILSSRLIDLVLNSDLGLSKQVRKGTFESKLSDVGNSASSGVKELIRLYYAVIR